MNLILSVDAMLIAEYRSIWSINFKYTDLVKVAVSSDEITRRCFVFTLPILRTLIKRSLYRQGEIKRGAFSEFAIEMQGSFMGFDN